MTQFMYMPKPYFYIQCTCRAKIDDPIKLHQRKQANEIG